MTSLIKRQALAGMAAASILLLAPGCSSDSATGPQTGASMSLSIRTTPGLGKLAESITLSSAKVLLREISFHEASSDESTDVESGSVVVSLRLDGSVTEITVGDIRPGVYDRISFDLHKPEDGEDVGDPDFGSGMSGSQRFSAVARGLYGMTGFIYRSRESARQEVRLASPMTVAEGSRVNVTLVVDPNRWFLVDGSVVDPNDRNNADRIDENIKASFEEGFRDDDRDGEPDSD